MAALVRFINPGSTSGGNGTTDSTVATDANRAYVSFSEFDTQEEADLTDAGGDTMTQRHLSPLARGSDQAPPVQGPG